MQLRSLEIHGFKSFAEKTKFVFDKGITGVVGPNGCGKSNIVDSIRWVLGEQKTRNLRSEKMENVIFNGTSKRKKANFAEVSLTFDNTKNILPTEYTTVTITRKYYRSGDSEYYLNKVPCRLKDITGLFMDTGIGSDSYAIIELKMVDEILNDKDNSRRTLFEEAAGISKYKVRKKQTLRKLKETQDDLERVEDILFEIEKNLKSLEKQAKKAKRYFELKEKYRVVSSRHAYFRIRGLREAYEAVEKEETNFEDSLGEIQSKVAKFESRIQELKKEQIDNESLLSDAQKDLNAHVEKIQGIETEKSIKNERLKFLQQREFAIGDQLDTEKRTRDRLKESLEEIRADLEVTRKEFAEKEKSLSTKKAHLDALKEQNEELKTQTKNTGEEHSELEKELQSLIKDKEIKQIQIESLGSEMTRNEEDKTERAEELDSFSSNLKELTEVSAKLEEEVNSLKAKKEKNDEEIEKTANELVEVKDAIYKTNRGLDARLNEYNLTKSLVENLEGFPESVKFLKKEAKWVKDAPLLSDVINTDSDHKVAFENLLEPYLSYYVVEDRTDALAAVKLLQDASKGRANFFILEELEGFKTRKKQEIPNCIHAPELVDVSETYKDLANYLLDHVYVVHDEIHIPDEVPEGIVFITRKGNVSRKKYSLSGGSIGLFQGKRLGRAKNLEKLNKEIKKFEKDLNIQKTKLAKLEKYQDSIKQHDFNVAWEEKNTEYQEKREQLSILTTREKEYREFIARVGERSETIFAELEKLKEELTGIDPKIEEVAKSLEEKSGIYEEYQRMLEGSDTALTETSQAYNQFHISFIQLKNKFENLEKDEAQKDERVVALTESEEKLLAELDQTRKDIHELVDNNLQNDEEIVSLYDEKKEKETRTEKFEQIAARIRNTINETEDKIRKERKQKEEIEENKSDIKERITEIKIQLNSLKERMQVEFQIEISDLEEEELFEKPVDQYDPDEIEESMHKIRNRIQNYGEINPMAVEAFDEMKERFDFIETQKQDLVDAKQALLDTIDEIDRTATEKFLESFVEVRENFIKVFQSLFHEGDTCDLKLVDESDPLESKINITARPKGKRPLTINQLSGGEKTLTAISLLFAIYLLKPAPFCIFDEVDAPLDDANIDKFNNIIRDFSAGSQFIIVTHNKRTMASTNVMYGVTMEQSGVSKVLPVNMVELNLN